MPNTSDILSPEATYHIYNRANGSERLFLSSENYRFFMQKYQEYVLPVADTFCYCLMPNHFHFLVRLKKEEELKALPAFPKFETLEKLMSKQFSNFFSCYSQAFNKHHGRMGSLFIKNFNRKKVTDDAYLKKLIHYIHYNPVEARLCKDPVDWEYSSYPILITDKDTFLKREELLSWFADMDNFIYYHSTATELGHINIM